MRSTKRNVVGPVGLLLLAINCFTPLLAVSACSQVSQQDTTIQEEWKRTNPDVVVYLPKHKNDGDNEHFLAFKAPKSEELLAIWTQSTVEGNGDNRAVIARSKDGINWSSPATITGKINKDDSRAQASWAFPVVSKTGRIYCFYSKDTVVSNITQHLMACAYSDDNGYTWRFGKKPIEVPKFKYDDPDPVQTPYWIVWQIPIRDGQGKYIAGYTRWSSETIVKRGKNWVDKDSRSGFIRFENIDDNPLPEEVVLTWLPKDNPEGLEVPHKLLPISVAQEPAVVLLPDNRLFAIMRTMTGFIWYSVSNDHGNTWRKPEVLRYKDGGEPIPHPMSPCPLYSLSNGKYLLLYANNEGKFGKYNQFKANWGGVNQASFIRQPAFISVGEYRPDSHQPVWFSQPEELLATDNVPVGPKGTAEVATYPSLTEWNGVRTLWYPDRKHFLLGKYLPDALLDQLVVPKVTK